MINGLMFGLVDKWIDRYTNNYYSPSLDKEVCIHVFTNSSCISLPLQSGISASFKNSITKSTKFGSVYNE